MKDVVIIQARMTSARLPGKVLMPMDSRPLLECVIDRIRQSCVKNIVVATSKDVSDDAIEERCRSLRVEIVRGELEDVAGRFRYALERTKADRFVRVSADSPFLDPLLIDQAVGLAETTGADVVTNVFPRTFPKGQSVEMVRADVFLRQPLFLSADQREHVTKYFYENASAFRIVNFTSGGEWGGRNMSIDTPEDMARALELIRNVGAGWDGLGWESLMGQMFGQKEGV